MLFHLLCSYVTPYFIPLELKDLIGQEGARVVGVLARGHKGGSVQGHVGRKVQG